MRVQLSRLSSILKRLRERKKILLEVLEGTPGVSLIRGHCLKGDCGSSFHLRFDDPQKAQAMSRKLIANKVIAILPSMRPAHVAWKWYKDVGASTQTAGGVAEFLPSISIIMSVLRYELDINLKKKQTHALGVKIKKLVRT